MANKPDYDVLISKEVPGKGDDDNKNFYTKIGAGWKVAKEGISISMDAVPTDGKIVLFPVKESGDAASSANT